MKIYRINHFEEIEQDRETVLVLGYFDGLHLGHQELFAAAREIAERDQLDMAVLTFPESPKLTFAKFHPDLMLHLNSPSERAQRFAEAGVNALYLIDFTGEFARTTAAAFLQNYIRKLKARAIVAGFDYRFASDQKDATYLTEHFDGQVVIVPELTLGGEKVSSTRIRQAVLEGRVAEANQLLGYAFATRGLVVHGDARGRTIGYPTANLALLDRVYLPKDGVYVADVLIAGRTYRAMASIGKNVTFDGSDLRIEAHIFDFEGDLYGQTITILWLDRLRDMIKFDGIEALMTQMREDEEKSRNWSDILP